LIFFREVVRDVAPFVCVTAHPYRAPLLWKMYLVAILQGFVETATAIDNEKQFLFWKTAPFKGRQKFIARGAVFGIALVNA